MSQWLETPAAEVVEERPVTKENIMESNTRPTQGGESVSRGLHGVRERAGKNKQERFTALLHHGLRLPVANTRSAPGIRFRSSIPPVDASVYTSPGASRRPGQDLRSRWFATPFLWGSFIPDYSRFIPTLALVDARGSVARQPHLEFAAH